MQGPCLGAIEEVGRGVIHARAKPRNHRAPRISIITDEEVASPSSQGTAVGTSASTAKVGSVRGRTSNGCIGETQRPPGNGGNRGKAGVCGAKI